MGIIKRHLLFVVSILACILLKVTTHGNLLSPHDISQIGSWLQRQNLAKEFSTFFLQEFDTELDFSTQIGYVLF